MKNKEFIERCVQLADKTNCTKIKVDGSLVILEDAWLFSSVIVETHPNPHIVIKSPLCGDVLNKIKVRRQKEKQDMLTQVLKKAKHDVYNRTKHS